MSIISLSPVRIGDIVHVSFMGSRFYVPEYRVLQIDPYLCKVFLEDFGWVDWSAVERVSGTTNGILAPCGNTGPDCQVPQESSLKIQDALGDIGGYKTRCDWLQGTITFTTAHAWKELLDKICKILGLQFVENKTGFTRGKSYQHSGYCEGGVMVAWNPPSDKSLSGEGWISIPGRVLASLSLESLKQLWVLLELGKTVKGKSGPVRLVYPFQATRLDIALDVFNPTFSMADVLRAAQRGNFVGFRHQAIQDKQGNWKAASYDYHASPYCDKDGNQREGLSVYFGRAGGNKRLNVYDKLAEALQNTKNLGLPIDTIYEQNDCIRFEGRFYDEMANVRFYALIKQFRKDDEGRSVAQEMAGMVVGCIDFRDRDVNPRIDRCPRLKWWDEICNCFERVILKCPRPLPSVERTLEWHFRQVAGSLGVVEGIFGFSALNEYLNKLLDIGREKLNATHDALIDLGVNALLAGELSLSGFYQQWQAVH